VRLYLVRHGKAVAEEVDPARPLSAAGRLEVEGVGRVLARMQVRPAAVIHSGKLRARQTAEILADALGTRDTLEEGADLTPNADPRPWVARVDERPEAMLVGHLPHLGRLVARLAGAPDREELVWLDLATVVCLSRPVPPERWSIGWILTSALARAFTD